jgi:hypothetical protein
VQSALACLLLLVAPVARAAPPVRHPTLVVEAAPGLEGTAADIRSLAAASWDTELDIVGLPGFTAPILIVLLPESSAEARTTASWVAGYAMGASRQVVVFPARAPSYPDRNREALLRHEVTHILVDEAAAQRAVPRWLHEGMAAVAAREWGLEDRARFALAVVGSRPQSIADLDRGFLSSGAGVARSYALSAAFVRFLQSRYGEEVTARLLARLASGKDVDGAFLAATGSSLGGAEAAFFGQETMWSVWLPFLTSSAVLWMGISVLALLAIRARRRRDAMLRAAWTEVEEMDGADGWGDGEEPGAEDDEVGDVDSRHWN